MAVCRAKKQAHQQAVQNGFCHLIIIVLDNSKVYVDINSTVEDRIYCDEQLEFDNLLKVCNNHRQTNYLCYHSNSGINLWLFFKVLLDRSYCAL